MALVTENDPFIAATHELADRVAGKGVAWLDQLRSDALDHYERAGLPTTKHEAWRTTPLRTIARTPFTPARAEATVVSEAELEHLRFGKDGGLTELVFIDGTFSPELSRTPETASGVHIDTLRSALATDAGALEKRLGALASWDENPLVALNTASFTDGVHVRLDADVTGPTIHVIHVATSEGTIMHPRALVELSTSAEATLIETFAGSAGASMTNAVTEAWLGPNARLDHVTFEREAPEAFHFHTFQAEIDRDSRLNTCVLSLGASLARNETNVRLVGEGADAKLNGLFPISGVQRVDNQTTIDHVVPHCTSSEVYKGILDDRSRGAFKGRIIVREGAQKTNSVQASRNLLLSDEALVASTPQLEIYADDVRCTHGATIGQLEDEELFYLRSRGIGPKSARSLLVYAFAREVIEAIAHEAARERAEALLLARLPRGDVAETVEAA